MVGIIGATVAGKETIHLAKALAGNGCRGRRGH